MWETALTMQNAPCNVLLPCNDGFDLPEKAPYHVRVKLRALITDRKTISLSTLAVVSLIACAAFAQATRSLIVNGKVASNDVRIINGKSYAPVADVAKALDLVVVQRPDGKIELTRQGGSGAIDAKLTGKVGDFLFDGGWRFKVVSVESVKEHTMVNKFITDQHVAEEGNRLIIVNVVIRNANKKLANLYPGDVALASEDGGSESVTHYDFPFNNSPSSFKPILPGAEQKGAILFEVKEDFKEKDLIFTISREYSHYDDAVLPKEDTVMRISLK